MNTTFPNRARSKMAAAERGAHSVVLSTIDAPFSKEFHLSDPIDPKTLLVSAKMDGLDVRSRDGERLGHVQAYMVDKRSGHTSYAVLSLGGFLGMGKSFYPIPFSLLSYDAVDDTYLVTVDRRVLEGGPSWANNAPDFNQAYADRVSSYYGAEAATIAQT